MKYKKEFDFLINSNTLPQGIQNSFEEVRKLRTKTYDLVGDKFPDVINLYRLRAKDNFLNLNLYYQCLADVYCSEIPDHADAWQTVSKAVSTYGRLNKPEFKFNLIEKCIDSIGGWVYLCASNQSEVIANRANFYKIYKEQYQKYKEGVMLSVLRD